MLFLAAAVAAATVAPSEDAPAVLPEQDRTQGERRLDEEELEQITVTGHRLAPFRAEVVQVGAFRNQSIMDTPASIAVMTRSLLDAQGALGLEEALRNTPGVTQQSTSPITSNNFVSRGVLMNARTNYRLNGALQIVNLGPIPIENKQRVELLKGVSALYYGISTPSGIVNVVTKRAGTQPVTSFYLSGDAEGGGGGGIDIGRAFGSDDQFGLRVNAYGATLETPINGVDGYRYVASGAFDWRVTDRLSVKADLEHYRRVTDEPGGISLPAAVNGHITLPDIPDPDNRYAPTNAPYRTWVTNGLGRVDYLLTDDWSVRAEAGYARTRRQRAIGNVAAVNVETGAGRVTTTYAADQEYSNLYWRSELAGKLDALGVRHDLLFGYARNRQEQEDQHTQSYAPFVQNIYDPIDVDFRDLTPTTTRFVAGSVNIDTGLYAMDMARLSDKILLIAGVRHVNYETQTADDTFTINTWTPTAGVVVRPTEKTSLYATYIEGLESAGTAPDGTVNAGEVLPAVRSKQIELGARAEFRGALVSVAWFHIDRGLDYTDLATNTQVVNGRAIHEGVEATLQGDLGHGFSAVLSGQYLDARQRETGVAAQEGKVVDGTPEWSGSAFIEYRPPAFRDFSVNAGLYYTGKRYTDVLNRGTLPDYATLSLGGSYRMAINSERAMTFRINADNLTNERYWSTGGSTLYVGLARTVRGSVTIDF